MTEKNRQMQAVSPLLQKIINWSSAIGALGTVAFCIWAYFAGVLQSKETLSAFIQQAGIWGPPLFIFLQILQTVVPIIPGALTSVAGVFIYGHIVGTIYNYIGIVIGCAIIFHLARTYGPAFVQSVVSKRTYDKYIGWLDKGNRFELLYLHDDLAHQSSRLSLYAGRPDQDDFQKVHADYPSLQAHHPRHLYLRIDLYH